MKPEIEDLKDSFKIGYEEFEASRREANEVWDLYHNRHYTLEQLATLANRGQPAETFNIIKKFSRMLLGYYSTVVNNCKVLPRQFRDVDTAALLNDVVKHTFVANRMQTLGDKLKLSALVSGLMVSFVNVRDSGYRDEFGRPINKIDLSYVPDSQVVLDPMSTEDDYSDARFLHRFKWLTKEAFVRQFGPKAEEEAQEFYNYLEVEEADFEFNHTEQFWGHYRVHNSYLVVHTVMEDDNGKRWSIYWHDDKILRKDEITFKEARWPYRVHRLHHSDKAEYYGIFREIVESQKAINQAVIAIQLMVNSDKVFVQDGAVENIAKFTAAYNRVNSVLEVKELNGIRVEKFTRELQEQYIIIDRALDRVQQVLGINDSFLGLAAASDSGRKVKLQQGAAIMALHYITARINEFYELLTWDVANLAKQYYTASQILRLTDELTGERWFALNQPMMEQVGVDPVGQPMMQPILLPAIDPASGELMTNDNGDYIMAPVPEAGTTIDFTEFDVEVNASAYNDEDEKAQLLLETMLSGQIGVMTSQVNPAGFFKLAALTMKSMKTKYSPNMADVLEQTAMMLSQNPEMQAQAQQMAATNPGTYRQQPMSKSLKLPTNTNEGI